MLHRTFIGVLAIVVLLVGGAFAAYAYDSSNERTIAEGVTAAGVDLGGMGELEARTALEQRVADPLARPVVVRHGGRAWKLTAERARLRVDVEQTVAEAIERSRDGSLFARSWRDLTGGRVAVALEPRVTYSRAAVAGLVKRVRADVDRPAVDAKLSYAGSGIRTVAGQTGRSLKAAALEREIGRRLVLPDGSRTVRAKVATTRPKVTQAQLADRHPAVIVVDRGSFKLRFYRRLKLVKTYTVAVGQVGMDTPAGLYNVQNKAVDPDWNVPDKPWAGKLRGKIIPGGTAENPLKARWMGIYNGAGIHGTDAVGSLGSRASHGCIRMAIPDVKELYEQVPVGAPVYIA